MDGGKCILQYAVVPLSDKYDNETPELQIFRLRQEKRFDGTAYAHLSAIKADSLIYEIDLSD